MQNVVFINHSTTKCKNSSNECSFITIHFIQKYLRDMPLVRVISYKSIKAVKRCKRITTSMKMFINLYSPSNDFINQSI